MQVCFADLNNEEIILQLMSQGPSRKGLPVEIQVISCFFTIHALYS